MIRACVFAAQLSIKINQLDLDHTEHDLVIQALEPLEADRKCFRMIGSVVVERTVKEVLPAVQKNKAQIKATIDQFTSLLDEKQKEADAFAAEHKITIQGAPGAPADASGGDESASQGVLI